jgi:hypothetical protein
MATTIAAVLYRPAEVSDRTLSQGFAVALGGFDVPSPRLLVAPLPGLPGFSAAFYASAAKIARGAEEEEFEHACELFEDELPPAQCVLDAAAPGAVVYAITYAEGALHDDAWRFDARGVVRHFVHEGDDTGIEVGFETSEAGGVRELDVPLPEDASEAEEARAIEAAARPHRGSTFLSQELGVPVIPALMGALFAADKRLLVRLVEPDPASIAEEVRRLNRVLRRVDGRGAPPPPDDVAGVAAPPGYKAFVETYDWADPADPQDLYRELAIGAIEGTLRFLRPEERAALASDAGWQKAARAGLYPIARLAGSSLGGAGAKGIVALGREDEALWITKPGGAAVAAGPTLGELVRYLALGWSKRSEAEEDMIGALMLRARLRVEKG